MNTGHIRTRLAAVEQQLADALDSARRNDSVDLSALRNVVDEVCRDILALPAAEARLLLPDLQRGIAALEQLATLLQTRQQQSEAAEKDATRLHAARAYGKAYR